MPFATENNDQQFLSDFSLQFDSLSNKREKADRFPTTRLAHNFLSDFSLEKDS